MEVYRIAKTRYVKDLTGSGARRYGGRWNHKGTPLIYTSETRALAAVEYLVHLPLSIVPADLSIAAIKIPDKITPKEISPEELPADWRGYPASSILADTGTAWAENNTGLLLRVPSAVIEHEFNILINPLHLDMKGVKIAAIEQFRIDERLIEKGKKGD